MNDTHDLAPAVAEEPDTPAPVARSRPAAEGPDIVFPLVALFLVIVVNLLVFANLNPPIVRPVLGFWFIFVFPGFLLFTSSAWRRCGLQERVAYSACGTLLILMLTGLVINEVLPLVGVKRPLDAGPVVIAGDVINVSLYLFQRRHADRAGMRDLFSALGRQELRLLVAASLAVVLAVFGANHLNNGASGHLTWVGLTLVAVIGVFSLRWMRVVRESVMSVVIYLASLSLLLSTSLRGWFVTGHDIQQEYVVFQLTQAHGHWSMANLQGAYNACLSITILPTELGQILSVYSPYVYKLFFQLIFALAPVLAYGVARRYFNRGISTLAVAYFVGFPTFFTDMPFLNRQEIALLFVGAGLLAATNPVWSLRRRQISLAVAGLGVELAHYSTMYVLLGILVIGLLCSYGARLTAWVGRLGQPLLRVAGLKNEGKPAASGKFSALRRAGQAGFTARGKETTAEPGPKAEPAAEAEPEAEAEPAAEAEPGAEDKPADKPEETGEPGSAAGPATEEGPGPAAAPPPAPVRKGKRVAAGGRRADLGSEAKYPLTLWVVGVMVGIVFIWGTLVTGTTGQVIDDGSSAITAGNISLSLFGKAGISPDQAIQDLRQSTIKSRGPNEASQYLPLSAAAKAQTPTIQQPLNPLTGIGAAASDVGVPVVGLNNLARNFVAYGEQLFLLIGIIRLFVAARRGRRMVGDQFFWLAVGAIGMIVLITVLPSIATDYGPLRAFQQGLLFFAPVIVIGSMTIFEPIGKYRARLAACAVCLIIFLATSTVLPQLVGGNLAELNLNNSGTYYDLYYTSPQQSSAVAWLGGQPRVLKYPIQAGYLQEKYIFTRPDIINGNQAIIDAYPTAVLKDSWVIFAPSEPDSDIFYTFTPSNGALTEYKYPQGLLDDYKNLVYTDGSAAIYK
jgi:uncharacterized membrane protein